MRRKQNYITKGALIIGSMTALGDVLAQWIEHNNREEEFTWEKYDGKRTLRNSIIGVGIGGVLGYGLYCYRLSEEAKLPFNSDEYLRKVLSKEHLRSRPDLLHIFLQKRQEIKEWLMLFFEHDLATEPQDTGSFKKYTAIASNFDLDIILPFKKNSYYSLKEMYDDVYNEIYHKFSKEATISRQTKAIGITFKIDNKEIHFDIVPGREINNYGKDKDLNLYANPNWVWQRGGSFKTNVKTQQTITGKKTQTRQVIKLLKIYKLRNDLPLSALEIEQSVMDCLSIKSYSTNSSITENFLNCMDYISKKLDKKMHIDKANSNNNLHNKSTNLVRQTIQSQLVMDIERIENNPRYIKELFEI